jgi:hypothetical protein
MLQDSNEQNDWQMNFSVDLAESKKNERLVIRMKFEAADITGLIDDVMSGEKMFRKG